MSYKHLNFKGVALKCHVLSCFDPALAMERSCSMCGICWSEVKAAWFPDLVSFLSFPPAPAPQKTFYETSVFGIVFDCDQGMNSSLSHYLLPSSQLNVEKFLWTNFIFCRNRDHFNWSLDDRKDDRIGQEWLCNVLLFKLFSQVVFWM